MTPECEHKLRVTQPFASVTHMHRAKAKRAGLAHCRASAPSEEDNVWLVLCHRLYNQPPAGVFDSLDDEEEVECD